jgi:hypothetical protein
MEMVIGFRVRVFYCAYTGSKVITTSERSVKPCHIHILTRVLPELVFSNENITSDLKSRKKMSQSTLRPV